MGEHRLGDRHDQADEECRTGRDGRERDGSSSAQGGIGVRVDDPVIDDEFGRKVWEERGECGMAR